MSPLKYAAFALGSAAVGALIPVMAVMNARLGRQLGEPIHAAVVLFVVGLLFSATISLLIVGRLPSIGAIGTASTINLAGGIIVATYVVGITFLVPRFGVGNAILFVMTAQVLTSAVIDHFGLFGASVQSVGLVRSLGLLILLLGLLLTQFSHD